MPAKGKTYLKGKVILPLAIAVLSFLTGTAVVRAAVSGPCVLCHTMHNSQDDFSQVHAGSGAGWNSSGILTSGAINSGVGTLLKSDCVGCHSSTSANTIVNMNGSGANVPIVFNIGAYPANPLAGGNFALNAGSADIYGHNVRDISSVDSKLAYAPGRLQGCASSCHTSLAIADPTGGALPTPDSRGGCEGCHTRVAHHKGSDSSYRFLGGHTGSFAIGNVLGTEDSNWEWDKSSTDHNVYMRHTGNETAGNISLGHFCAGCHQEFHAPGGVNVWGADNAGDDNTDDAITGGVNAWLRHPSNVNIPDDGEYTDLFLAGNNDYNPDIPVAQDLAGNTNIVDSGDQVTCISCHRAHASDRPDALRFDYNAMVAHSGSGNTTDGCFYCHRTKDLP